MSANQNLLALQDFLLDEVTNALNISPSTTPDQKPRSHSMSNKETRRSPLSSLFLKPEPVPSPALTLKTISTHAADALDEDLDEDVIIVQHISAVSRLSFLIDPLLTFCLIQTPFSHQNKSLDEAGFITFCHYYE